ncbi:MAG: carbohydrate porin [Thiohalocapsa sp.]|nr:carbohydrate porin [Thiohalocapsa sp.]MCF7991377.1 carbohydrate porin [Thiohalocapsa sp.]
MMKQLSDLSPVLRVLPVLALIPVSAKAYDITDRFSLSGVVAAAGQCTDVSARLPAEDFSDAIPGAFDNTCRGAMPIQIAASLLASERDEFFLRLGYAVDNGLNPVSPFRLAPWAADLEDDLEDINGRGRDYLLAAWYRHTFALGEEASLGASLGILDTTDYLDGNAYANDEYTQFMNEVFVNSGSYGLPSYDAGVALEATLGDVSLTGVGMNVGENDDGNNYNFWGVQAGWHPELALGPGNYRVIAAGASADFLDPEGFETQARLGYGLSFDQALGDTVGVFLRLAWRNDDAAVDYEALYSGGVSLIGAAWGRETDNIGVGYAYLEGGNTDVRRSNVFEAYYRTQVNDFFALTADLQYMSDALIDADPAQEDPEGWIFGLRATAEF